VLDPRERRDDAECAVGTIAMRRAGVLGRAPLMEDLELARTLLAYDSGEPADFSTWRTRHLAGIAHDRDLRQRLADVGLLAAEFPASPDIEAVVKWREALRRTI
jgi:hypothetical protein